MKSFPIKATLTVTALSALLLTAGTLSGCGGGGGGGGDVGRPAELPKILAASDAATSGGDAGSRSYIPNYVSNLAAVRHWDKSVVTVSITSPTGRDMTPLVQQAITLWASRVGQDVSLRIVPDSPTTPADIAVRWVDPLTLSSDTVGRTDVVFQLADQVLTSAQVQVSSSLPDAYQVQVLTHELGHALGIQGHSADNADLMYVNAHLPALITASDENTILWAYGASRSVSLPTGRASDPVSNSAVTDTGAGLSLGADLGVAHSTCGNGE